MSTSKQKQEPTLAERASDYCRQGEDAAYYMMGLADAFEAMGEDRFKAICHRLRDHAHELNMGTLYVEHGYKDRKGTT